MEMKSLDGPPRSHNTNPVAVSDRQSNLQASSDTGMLPENQNIIFATNYSVSSVDQFVVSARKSDWNGRKRARNASPTDSEDQEEVEPNCQGSKSARKSARRKLKTVKLEKSRVRYDINLVPMVDRNKTFLNKWREGCGFKTTENSDEENVDDGDKDRRVCFACQALGSPFGGDSSTVWIPSSRGEWEDCLSEMTAVCTSAALRRHVAGRDRSTTKPFYAPLSQDYIRDRVDIDDPLMGYQIRHKSGGWLQGFIMYTHFTTWTHYFKWDSLHAMSGVQLGPESKTRPGYKVDTDGSLANELEGQPRSGDPLGGGVVFETIAEIGLLGGLGCGEYLLRMALDDIRKNGSYRFVVLQATDSSRAFYERFGFVRVGAISRYGPKTGAKSVDPKDVTLSDIMGYRHWTYAHESEHSLGKHGGPSYMMALKILSPMPPSGVSVCKKCGRGMQSLTDIITSHAVVVKPKITQLGSTPTPGSKRKTFQPSASGTPLPHADLSSVDYTKKREKKRRSITGLGRKAQIPRGPDHRIVSLPPPVRPFSAPLRQLNMPPPRKPAILFQTNGAARKAGDNYKPIEQRNTFLSPPEPGMPLSYNQKQYQDPWMGISATRTPSGDRRAPKQRAATSPHTPIGIFGTNSASGFAPNRRKSRTGGPGRDSGPGQGILLRDAPCLPREVDFGYERPFSTFGFTSAKPEERVHTGGDSLLRKQRMPYVPKSFPKDRLFFNKVVKLKGSKTDEYFLVVHFDMKLPRMKLLPLQMDGVFSENRHGRPRHKAATEKQVMIANVSKYEIVPARAVTNTPYVDCETYDLME